jgi:hypothetical protein
MQATFPLFFSGMVATFWVEVSERSEATNEAN